jgi:pimeloyl-ACP methyl ester carboxylesterase
MIYDTRKWKASHERRDRQRQALTTLMRCHAARIRTRRPPLLAVLGKNDPYFLPPGAKALQRDNPDAEVHLVDAGHFALESKEEEIAGIIREFLGRAVSRSSLSVDH